MRFPYGIYEQNKYPLRGFLPSVFSGKIPPRFVWRQNLFMELEHSYIETNGICLHVVQAGPKSGIPVVLLHGFPEFWYG